MKTLVVYYSRTGNTKRVAECIADALGADLLQLTEQEDRQGARGYVVAGWAAMRRKEAALDPLEKDPGDYDLVVVGTPVWAFTVTPAVRTFLNRYSSSIESTAFFCTMGGSGATRTFQEMESLCGAAPLATLSLNDKQLKNEDVGEIVKPFAATIANALEKEPDQTPENEG